MKTISHLLFALCLLVPGIASAQCDPISALPFTESFEDNSPTRDCWTQQIVSGNNQWSWGSGAVSGPPTVAFDGSKYAYFTDEGNGEITKLISPVLDLSAYSSPCILTFYYAQYMWSGDQNILNVYFRTSSTAPWILLFSDNANRSAWTYKMLELPSPSASYQIAFEGVDNYGYPNAVDLVSVMPPCGTVTQFPFTESFENNSPTRYCWSQEVVSGNKSWSFQPGALEGSVIQAHSGELNAWFTNDWGLNYTTKLISPVLDLSAMTLPAQLNFYYAQEEHQGNQNVLTVFYRTHPDSAWVFLWGDSANRPAWTHGSINLPDLTATYQLAFEGYTSNGYANVLDKVMISECPVPQNLQISGITSTEATIGWMTGGFEYAWDIRVDEAGFNPDISGEYYPDLAMNTLSLSNLTEGTLYDVYIRPVCNANSTNPWVGPYRFYTRYTLPYFEDFEDESLNPVAPGWSSITETQVSWHNPTVQRAAGGFNESFCAVLDDCVDYKKSAPTDETQVEEVILISPEIQAPLNTLRVKFKAAIGPGAQFCGIPGIAVGTMSDPANYASFTEYTLVPLTEDWNSFTVNLNLLTTNDAYLAFRLIFSDYGFGRAKIDEVLISTLPACLEPLNFHTDSIQEDGISLSWTPAQNEIQWDILYDYQGFNPFEAGILEAGLSAANTTISGLLPGLVYDFYVRADCGNGGYSDWSGPLSLEMPCGAVSAPVVESFDMTEENQLPHCWTGLANLPSAVTVVSDFNTSAPHALFMLNDPGATDTVYFISPMLADPLNTLMITFNAYSYGWGDLFTLGTLSDPADPSTFTPVYDFFQIPEYSEWAWDFGDYTGSDQYIAFRLTEDAFLLLDDIVIEAPFICQMPESVSIQSLEPNAVTLSWVAVNQETSWNVIFGQPGFDPWTEGTLIEGITDNPFTLNDLDQGLSYDIYVNAQCYNGDWSEWSGPVGFTTPCAPQPIPFLENFEGLVSGSLPECWLTTDGNGDGSTWTVGDDGSGSNSTVLITPPNGQIPHNDWFFSPPFLLQAGHVYTVSFDYMADQANPNNQIAVFIGTSANPAAMNMNSLFTTTVSNTDYQNGSFSFMPAADGIQVFGWYCMSGSPQSTMFIDNISITEALQTTCPQNLFACTGGFPIVLSGATPPGGVYSGAYVYQNQNQEYVFDPSTLSAGQYVVTYTYSTPFASSSCDFIIIVADPPVVTCPPDIYIAPEADPFQLTGGNPAGGSYFGQAVVNNMFHPMMASTGANSVGYMYTDPITLCQGFCSFTVYMNEVVNMVCPADFSLCVGASSVILSGASPAGGVYSGPGVSLNPNQEFIFDPSSLTTGGYTITYTYTTQFGSNSCDFDINIVELPEVTCPEDMTVSPNAAPFQLTGALPAGGSYFGQAVVNNMFHPMMASTGANSVGYMYTDPITLCQGFCSFTVYMNEVVNMVCPPDFSLCVGASSVILSGASPAGGVYSGTGVYQGQNQEYIFDPALADPGNHTITYTYTTQYGIYTCTFIATVNDLPELTCPSDMTIAANAVPFQLSGATPLGGIYSGQAVLNDMFDPALAVIGPNNVLYTYTDPVTLCQSNCEFTVEVTEVVNMVCPNDTLVCINTPPFVLTGESPAGGVFSGPGVYQNQNLQYLFNPAMAGAGEFTITYTYTTPFDTYTCTYQITVVALPIILAPNDFSLCLNDPPQPLTGGTPAGGIYSGPGVTNGIFDPAAAGVGNYTITYIYTNSYGCSAQSSFHIQVMPLSVVSVQIQSQNLTVCSGQAVDLNALVQQAGSNPLIQWYVNNSLISQTGPVIQLNPLISSTVYSVATATVPCAVNNPDTSNVLTINVLPNLNPSLSIAADDDTVCTGVSVTYHVVSVADTGLNPVFQWQVNGVNVGTNLQTYTYVPGIADIVRCQLTVNEPCAIQNPVFSNSLNTVVMPDPIVQLVLPLDSLCINWDPLILSGGTPTGGTYSGPGVSNQQFNPLSAGTGTHLITYTWTDFWGCTGNASAALYVDLCTGISEAGESGTPLLYPNPANQILFIKNIDPEAVPIILVDMQGRRQSGFTTSRIEGGISVDISDLSPGIYLVRIGDISLKFNIIH